MNQVLIGCRVARAHEREQRHRGRNWLECQRYRDTRVQSHSVTVNSVSKPQLWALLYQFHNDLRTIETQQREENQRPLLVPILSSQTAAETLQPTSLPTGDIFSVESAEGNAGSARDVTSKWVKTGISNVDHSSHHHLIFHEGPQKITPW